MGTPIPAHVWDAFRIDQATSGNKPNTVAIEALGVEWDYGIRVGDVVLSEVMDSTRAAWSAKMRQTLTPEGLRFARPLRSTDGRAIVGGWRASTYLPGKRQARVDEIVMAALRLDDALSEVEVPKFATDKVATPWTEADKYLVADHAAWAKDPAAILTPGLDTEAVADASIAWALTMAARLQAHLQELDVSRQPCHADMAATTIFDPNDDLSPVVTDLVCVARPYGYTAAVAIIDGLLAEAVDEGILQRFGNIGHLRQLLLRALLYRVFIHGLIADSEAATRTHIERVATLLLNDEQH